MRTICIDSDFRNSFHSGGKQRPPQAVSFNSCKSSQQFCQVKRDGRVLSRMRFTPSQVVGRIQAYAHFRINNGAFHVWPIHHRTNACDFLMNDAQCPLQPHTAYTYEMRAKFPHDVPLNAPFHVYITVRDENRREVLSCFRTLVTVTQ